MPPRYPVNIQDNTICHSAAHDFPVSPFSEYYGRDSSIIRFVAHLKLAHTQLYTYIRKPLFLYMLDYYTFYRCLQNENYQ